MINAKLMKTARTMYVYADGHAVLCHERRDNEAGYINWCTLHESIGLKAVRFPMDEGRLIVSGPEAIAMVLKCQAIRARAESIDEGSPNTRELGLAVGHVSMHFGQGFVSFQTMDKVLSGPFTYQPAISERWEDVADKHRWGDNNVAQTFTKPKAKETA